MTAMTETIDKLRKQAGVTAAEAIASTARAFALQPKLLDLFVEPRLSELGAAEIKAKAEKHLAETLVIDFGVIYEGHLRHMIVLRAAIVYADRLLEIEGRLVN